LDSKLKEDDRQKGEAKRSKAKGTFALGNCAHQVFVKMPKRET